MTRMHIVASDFSGLAWIVLAIPFGLIGLALASIVPAIRGHWSAALLAAAPVLLGLLYASLLLFASARSGMMPVGTCAVLLAPPAIGTLSLVVWAARRRPRE